jgi:hypothetical protein
MQLMRNWIKQLHFTPIDPLLKSNNAAFVSFVQRDLLSEQVFEKEIIWKLQ